MRGNAKAQRTVTENTTTDHQIDIIVFDLSEVLIRGLLGVENGLAQELNVPASTVLPALAGPDLRALFEGKLSEHEYLDRCIRAQGWPITRERVKQVIRENFQHEVEGMPALVACLAARRFRLALLSDHAREWVEHIHAVHPFLRVFPQRLYSFDLGDVKQDLQTFQAALESLSVAASRCLFVDDNPANVETARAVGIQGIVFSDAGQLRAALEPLTGPLACE
jgi:HAD superfamily hydrolase (TIGR01509 family)